MTMLAVEVEGALSYVRYKQPPARSWRQTATRGGTPPEQNPQKLEPACSPLHSHSSEPSYDVGLIVFSGSTWSRDPLHLIALVCLLALGVGRELSEDLGLVVVVYCECLHIYDVSNGHQGITVF